jgi:hypothetical protein
LPSFLKRSLDICHPNIRKKKKNELLNSLEYIH